MYLIAAAFLISISSCTDDNQLTSDDSPVVVEAYLHVNRLVKVNLSNLAGVAPTDVDHFTVTVSNNEGTFLLHPTGSGIYTSDSDVLVKEGVGDYTLNFLSDNEEITSLTVVPTKPENFQASKSEITITPIDFSQGPPRGGPSTESIALTWNNLDNGYYFTFFKNLESNPELINHLRDTAGGNAPRLFFRGEPTQEDNSEIRYGQFQYYGRYHIILFHVNPDYAGLYKEQENSSSLNLTSPFTNIVNGLGIFTAIHSDTVELLVKKP